jgi:Fe(3+) dicitrate transport protein
MPRSAGSIGAIAVVVVLTSSLEARAETDEPPETVLVQGERADALKAAAGSGTTITQQDIERAQPESSSEMLRRAPGLQIRQEDPMGLRLNLGVRGLSPTRSRLVLVEEDGVPVVVSPYGEPELYYMTQVERVQRLDVVKGSDVLLHGPQTVGAVIRLSTWEPTEQPSWYVAGTAGSRTYGEGIVRYADTSGDVGYVVQAFHKGGDGYRNMGFEMTDVFAKVRFPTGPRGELRAKIAFHDELANTTYTGLTDMLYRQEPRQDTVAPDDHFGIQRYEASLQHEQHVGDAGTLRTAVFAYQMDLGLRLQDFDRSPLPQIHYARVADPSALLFRNTTSLRDRVYDVAGASAEIEARGTTGDVRHRVTAGARAMADVARRRLSSGAFPTGESGDLLTDDTTHIVGLAAWIEDQLAMSDRVVLTPAVRVEHSDSKKTTHRIADPGRAPVDVDLIGSSSAAGVMPGLGLAIGSPRLAVFSSLYRGYSAPRVSQAITPDGHDANLHAERSSNYEAGVRGRAGKWFRGEADAFWINFDNQLVSNNPLSGATSEFVDGGRTRHLGAEGTVTLRAGEALALPIDLDLGGHYTFVRSRFASGTFAGHAIPYAPAHTAQLTLDAAHRIGLSGQVAFSYVGAQFTDEQNTAQGGPTGLDGRIDPYTVIDLGARYRHERTGLSLALAIKNAMDRVYISDRLPNGIFTAGFRQIFVTLAWSTSQR